MRRIQECKSALLNRLSSQIPNGTDEREAFINIKWDLMVELDQLRVMEEKM